jgi:hypothetical protein
MEQAEAREDRLRPKPQRGGLARVELASRFTHDLQVLDRRTGFGEQGQRLGLGVERVEGLGLAGCPTTRLGLAREHDGKLGLLVACAALTAG